MGATMTLRLTARHEARGHRYEVMVFIEAGTLAPLAFIAKDGSTDAYPARVALNADLPFPTPEELLAKVVADIDAGRHDLS